MQQPTEIFFHLLRYAIGSEEKFPYDINDEEWEMIFDISVKQALTGIAYYGVCKLPEEKRPQKGLLVKWHILCEQIKKRNIQLNTLACKVSEKFRKEGFRNTILKGQGIASLYPMPLYRQSGDIDIWLEGERDSIVKYLRGIAPAKEMISYHHTDFPVFKDTEIEVHFTPTWMNGYFGNRKLQRYFKECTPREFTNLQPIGKEDEKATISTLQFNRVFILLHIYRHLFAEGIGLRQLLDYYMVLRQGFTTEERDSTLRTMKELRVIGFTRATMYVLHKVFGLEKRYMLVEPDCKEGEFLLNEIMIAGNFGWYDKRYGDLLGNNLPKRVYGKMRHVMRLFRYHPTESICSPLYKAWHYIWRRRKEKYYKSSKFNNQ